MGVIKSQVLNDWYSQYNLSAVIADVLIILIGLIITRAIYYYIFDNFSLLKFVVIAVIVQIIHDILFFIFFSNMPRGLTFNLQAKNWPGDVYYFCYHKW